MVKRLEQLKRQSSSHDAPANQQKPFSAASSSAPQPKSSHQGMSRTVPSKSTQDASQQEFDEFRPDMDDGYEEPRPSAEYVHHWAAYRKDGNKENRPAPKPNTKASLLDRQPGAQRVSWNTQDSEAGPPTQKRTRQEPEHEEEDGDNEQEEEQQEEQAEESEDEGFEQDSRVPDPGRRAAVHTARRQSPPEDVHRPRPPKRQRVERPANNADRDAHENAHGWQQRLETESQGSARPEANHAEDEEYHPTPTFTQISAAARLNGVRSRIKNDPQRRTFWSEADSQRLIEAIEQFGCSWSLIAKNVEFEDDRDQIALKDKARNMKVAFLK